MSCTSSSSWSKTLGAGLSWMERGAGGHGCRAVVARAKS